MQPSRDGAQSARTDNVGFLVWLLSWSVLEWLGSRSKRAVDSASGKSTSTVPRSGVPTPDPVARAAPTDPSSAKPGHTHFRVPDYIGDGVIAKALGWSDGRIKDDMDRMHKLGAVVADSLGFSEELSPIEQQRIYQYYLPIYFWALDQLQQHKQSGSKGPLVLGISAPQGCGKTTIVMELEKLFATEGLRCASISIDDFYLSHADQQQLSSAQPDNRLVQGRGNAGTHDLHLGSDTLKNLCSLGDGQTFAVPRYDKSAYGGQGDTADKENWPIVTGPLDVVLFEGWMLGFSPVGTEKAAAVEDAMGKVDELLRAYKDAWDSHVNAWLVIKVATAEWVFKWRLEAEQKMKAAGKDGMSDEGVREFVSRYLPAYDAYLPGLYAQGPTTAQKGKLLYVEVDENRALAQAEAR